MTIVMNMNSYEIENEALDAEYGDEIMSVGWNPDVGLLQGQLELVPTSEQSALPDDLSTVAAELFLRKMYSYQR